MTRFSFSSLRFRLILLVLLAVVPAAGLMLYTGLEARQTAAAAAQQDALQLAILASADQDSLIESTRQLLAGLVRQPEVRQGDAAACSALLADLVKQNSRYANLGVVKPNGDLWCSAVPISSPANYANRAWYSEVMRTHDFVIGGYGMGTVTRKPLSTFAYPVLDDARQIQGIVSAGIDLAWLNQFIARTALPPGSVLTVMDSTGIILARSVQPENWVGKQADAPIVKIILERKNQGAVEAIGLDGVNRLYAFTPLGSQLQTGNAYVFVGIPTAVAYAQADQTLTRNLIALGVVMALALLAAWWGSDAMVLRPLNGLLKATTRLARGDLDARTETAQGAGEISLLARAFDEMAANLQSSLGETAYNRRLLLALSQAAQAVQRMHTPQEIYRTVGEEITRLGYNAVITMVAPDRSHLTIAYLIFNPTLLQTAEKLAGITAHELRLPLTPGGIYDRVITEKRPHFVEEENEHIAEVLPGLLRPLAARLAAILGLGHSIYAPLVIGDAVLGLLTVIGAGLTETDAPVVNTFANQIAIALENARLYAAVQDELVERKRAEEALKRRVNELNALNSMASIVNQSLDVDEILNRALDEALRQVGVEGAAMFLLNKDAGELVLVAHRNVPEGLARGLSRLKLGEGLPGRAAQIGQLVIMSHSTEYVGTQPTYIQREGIQSMAAVPLMGNAGVIGVMNLATARPDYFDVAGQQVLMSLGRQIAIGVEKARLYAESRRRNRELSVLYTIGRAATESLELEKTLSNAVAATLEALEIEIGGIYLLEPDGETLTLRVVHGVSDETAKDLRQVKFGEGLSGRAVAEKKPLVLEVQDYPSARLAPHILREGIQSSVSVPLLSAGQAVGAMNLSVRRSRVFPPEELDLLSAIGRELGGAVQNAQLFEEVKRELTERKRAEEALAYSRDLLNLTGQIAKVGGWELDLETQTLNWSEETYRIHEVDPATPPNLAEAINFYAPESQPAISAAVQAGIDSGTPWDLELELITAKGRRVAVRAQGAAERRDGRTVRLYGAFQDITARKQAEEKLLASEERYRRLFEAARDGILILNAETGMIVDVNPFLIDLLGFPREQFIEKKIWDIGFFKDIAANQDSFAELQRKEYIHYENLPLETADGRRIAVEFVSHVYQVSHTKVIQCNIRDITDRRRAEETLAQKAIELERSNKELEQFAYVASHDLQEPLRMVASYLQLIERRYGDRLDGDAREFMGYAVDGANRMKALINDLLAYSRVGTRGNPFGPVECETSLAQATANLQVAIAEHAAVITHDPLPAVTGDAVQLTQLLQNLIGNAIKFHSAEPPRVHISVKVEGERMKDETSSLILHPSSFVFSVRDNGIGIEPQYFDRVFAIFQRLHTRSDYPGTGIGLAICKKIVERHGGRIWVESQPGQGATFYFTIPA